MHALDGIRILDFTQMMLGPYATQMLADFGADVIKVERPEGEWERTLPMMGGFVDGESAAFLAMNRNKRSLALDLKAPGVRDALLAIGAQSDVVVENFRPGVMDRLGLGYEDFRAVRPDIIYCSGSGWGQDTPLARLDRPGQDLLIQAMSGLAAATGRAGDPPTPAGTSIVDHATAMSLAVGILAALVARSTHGVGQRVEVDLYSTAIAMQCQEISALVNLGTDWTRSAAGIGGAWLNAPFGLYEASDGWFALSMADLGQIAGVFDDPSIADLDPWVDRDEVKRRIDRVAIGGTVDGWVAALLEAGLWSAPVRTTGQAVAELRELGSPLLQDVVRSTGETITLVGNPVTMSATPWQLRAAPPEPGEHTREILAEFLDDETVDGLLGQTS
jgi:crotonobetainyl-CoA:carnitine CoA-transferase CaiB-like acyl-CoA transferase